MVAKFERNSAEIEKLLRSPAVMAECKRRADNIARAAGPGFRTAAEQGTGRARAVVWAGTYEARKAEANDRALTRAIDAGRD